MDIFGSYIKLVLKALSRGEFAFEIDGFYSGVVEARVGCMQSRRAISQRKVINLRRSRVRFTLQRAETLTRAKAQMRCTL